MEENHADGRTRTLLQSKMVAFSTLLELPTVSDGETKKDGKIFFELKQYLNNQEQEFSAFSSDLIENYDVACMEIF